MAQDPVALIGEKEIKRMLNGLPEKLSYKILLATERKAARHLVTAAKRRAPEASRSANEWWGRRKKNTPSIRVQKGTLKKSIGVVKVKASSDFPTIMIGPRKGRKQKYNGWFGIFPEYGTKGYVIRKGQFRGRYMPGQKANPFMHPAFAESKDKMMYEMTQGIGKVAQKYLKKYAK